MGIDRNEMFRDTNKSAMEYARHAIQFSFLLNGAAATALFAKDGMLFVNAACWFAVGSGVAVICMGVAYLVQILIASALPYEDNVCRFLFLGKVRLLSPLGVENARVAAIILWALSIVFFFVGAIKAWLII